MELVLQQKQTLNLVMTTELRQAIELLQYSTYDLLQFVREQEEENPFIELIDKSFDSQPIRRNESRRTSFSANDVDPLDFIASDGQDGYDDLIEQLNWLDEDERMKNIVEYLILNLNETGYLMLTNKEILDFFNIDDSTLERAIEVLQSLDPLGVGARDLAECLLIQARYLYPEEEDLHSVLTDHLEDLANRRWNEITKSLNISLADVKRIHKLIQSLEPKPITLMASERVEYLEPDIVVEVDEESGDFQVYLNDYYVPDVQFNRTYSQNVKSAEKEVSQYVNEFYKRYQWLQNSIEQRRHTILNIMQVLLVEQEAFFTEGLKALKPLTLKDVADAIDMHESTISRATANKVIQTPQGTFELRVLFSTRLNTTSGSDASQTTVKMMLQEVVDNEDKYKPLSDQKIADILEEDKGVKISRRTVAKYRNELNIPSSSRRKEIKV